MKIPQKELWNLCDYLIDFILPRLIAFQKMKRQSCCSDFKSMSQWNKVLDKMIFAFDYKKNEHTRGFYKKRNIKDPYRKTKDNLEYCKTYQLENGRVSMSFDKDPEPKLPNIIEIKKHYQDTKLVMKYHKKAQEGFELFGKYLNHLWD